MSPNFEGRLIIGPTCSSECLWLSLKSYSTRMATSSLQKSALRGPSRFDRCAINPFRIQSYRPPRALWDSWEIHIDSPLWLIGFLWGLPRSDSLDIYIYLSARDQWAGNGVLRKLSQMIIVWPYSRRFREFAATEKLRWSTRRPSGIAMRCKPVYLWRDCMPQRVMTCASRQASAIL